MGTFEHRPVLLDEVLTALSPRDGGVYADGTVGGAGHAAAILAASSPTGWLYGCDRDGLALEAAGERLKPYEGRHELRRGNFAELCGWVPAGVCDGVLLDLGVSSPQLDVAERGFSFQQDGPLDMRMDQRQEMTAAELLNTWDAEDLASVFWRYGDERDSRRVARAIVHDREAVPFKRTRQLAELLERLLPKRGRAHPGTKVFQALRIAVNDEMGSLERGLAGVVGLLKPGGRLAVITFHSLEDRTVKHFGRSRTRDYDFDGPVDIPELRRPKVPELRWVSRKATCPGDLELAENPRSRSAQLRVFEKA